MVHRTYVTVRLTALLMSQLKIAHDVPVQCELDCRIASELAAAMRGLIISSDYDRVPCSAVLRSVTRNFVELFGPVAGDITITTRIVPLQLAAFKRRALALVVVNLLSNALLEAFCGLEEGHIEVQLAQPSRSYGRLIIMDNGRAQSVAAPRESQQISNDLANLLEAEVRYRTLGLDGTVVEIDFPIQD
jgi:two-component sensor histidine kinase